MKSLVGLLFGVILVLAYFLYQQDSKIEDQKKAITNLSSQVTANINKQKSFEYQERCAEQARKTFSDLGYKQKQTAAYQNHYNETLNKCFVEIMNTEQSPPGTFVTSRLVVDALEGKLYGQYIWATQKNKKYWEVPPLMCKVVLPSGEERYCKSDEEFTELLKPYMDASVE